MTDTPDAVQQVQDQDTSNAQRKFNDPYAFLATLANAPSREQIEAWKLQTPNSRLRVFTPDGGKRVFIVRAVAGMELQRLQAQIIENMSPEKKELELQYLVGAACVLWANYANGRLSPDDLRNGSAGLPVTLFNLISWLSDFVDPEAFGVLSAEL